MQTTRAVLAVIVSVAIAGTGCSDVGIAPTAGPSVPNATPDAGPTPAAASTGLPGGRPGVAHPDDDLAPDALQIPKLTGNEERLQRLGQIYDFCRGYAQLDKLEQAPDYEFAQLTRYADVSFNLLGSIDLRRDILDRRAGERGARMKLPDEVVKAVGATRQELFAFSQRVRYAWDLHNRKAITEDKYRHRVDVAFVKLATGSYDSADQLLTAFWESRC